MFSPGCLLSEMLLAALIVKLDERLARKISSEGGSSKLSHTTSIETSTASNNIEQRSPDKRQSRPRL